MESEYADTFDRNLMALYGKQDGQPTLMDHTTRKKEIHKYLKDPSQRMGETEGTLNQINITSPQANDNN